MLRSFEQLCHPANGDLLIAADEERATIAVGGADAKSCAKPYAMPWHWHDCFMFILPSRGAVELKHEDQRRGTWLSQDRFAIVPPHRAHETQAGLGAHHHVALYATGTALSKLDKKVGSLSEFYRRTRSTTLIRRSSAIRTLQELSVRGDIGAYGNSAIRQQLSAALLLQCIAEVVASEKLPNASHREHGMALVSDLKAFIAVNFDEEISLDALEQRFGISRRHITRLFRQGTELSIGEYQQRIRVETARLLLIETDLPVGEIAFRVGFDSGTALARAMRRVCGETPSDVRSRVARSVET